jgi:6-phosphofructo-2-kinase/fructose-2,6-biphosphatase 2
MAVDPPAQFQQEMHRIPQGDLIRPLRKTNGVGVQAEDTKICVVMVGLPARGKSLIAQKGTPLRLLQLSARQFEPNTLQ